MLYDITYHMYPSKDITITVDAQSEEEAMVYAKSFRNDAYSIKERIGLRKEDPWMKVLEGRVEELKQKHDACEQNIHDTVKRFRKWAAEADETDIYYDVEYRIQSVVDARTTYKAVWKRLKEAEAELEKYKETVCEMGA